VLTNRSTFARGEVIVSPIRADQSLDVRDAFAKGVYGRIFIWIVGKINQAVYKPTVSFLLLPSLNKNQPRLTVLIHFLQILSLILFFCFYYNFDLHLCNCYTSSGKVFGGDILWKNTILNKYTSTWYNFQINT